VIPAAKKEIHKIEDVTKVSFGGTGENKKDTGKLKDEEYVNDEDDEMVMHSGRAQVRTKKSLADSLQKKHIFDNGAKLNDSAVFNSHS
jgi:hypothetical protein